MRFPLSPSDAFHLDVANDHVGCLWLLDAMPAAGSLEDLARRLCAGNARMRASLDRRAGSWCEQPGFDPAGQVVHAEPSRDLATMLKQLAALYVAPLLEGRPPWRAILLPITGDGPALCFLAHHAFTDGVRGFHLARAFAGHDVPGEVSSADRGQAEGVGLAVMAQLLRESLADITRPRARAVPKHYDSGKRVFHCAWIQAAQLQAAARREGTGRAELLARVFSRALAQTFGARAISLMVPRDVGSRGGEGNGFLPEIRTFRFDRRGCSSPLFADPLSAGRLATRTTAARLRMTILSRLPGPLAAVGYHRWADGFDALCTILPNLFQGTSIAGARVVAAFGVPPLIWRQPLSAAAIVGRAGTSLLIASDPAAAEGETVLRETLRLLEAPG